jgi:tetratricopeptide (TPR) repeat protein
VPVYDAFLSYSHAKDKPIAAALQSVIQKLGKPWYRRRALRVFRDDTSLSATPSLWPSIEAALGESRYLILLSAPESAASPWVGKEIEYWLSHKSTDTLLIGVTSGALDWEGKTGDFRWEPSPPLPAALKGRFPAEPKWVDLTAYRDGADPKDSRFIELGADFAAAIHGMPKDDLLSQEVRQQRRALTLAMTAVGLLLVLAAGAITAGIIAKVQAERAERNYAAARSTVDSLIRNVAVGLRDVEGLRGETIARVLNTVKGTIDQLAKTNPEDLRLEESRGVMHGEFSKTYLTAGDQKRAMEATMEALKISRKLAEREPSGNAYRRNTAMNLLTIGYLNSLAGDTVETEKAYRESIDLMRELVAREPANSESQNDLAFSLDKLGELRWQARDIEGAYDPIAEALDIRRLLVAREPGRALWQMWLAGSHDRVGQLKLLMGEIEVAAQHRERSLAIMRRLTADDPANTEWQRDLAIGLRSYGEVSERRGRPEEALKAYEESLAIERRLTKLDPNNATWRRGLGTALDRIGTVRQRTGNAEGASAAYEEARDIFGRLVAADPRNEQAQVSLIILLSKLGELAEKRGDVERARAAYREWLEFLEKQAAADPRNPNWQTDKVQPLLYLAQVGDRPRERLVMAREILHEAEMKGALTPQQKRWVSYVEQALAKLPE